MLRDAWRLAVGTLTAIPVRPPVVVDRRRAQLAMVLAPLAVLPLGLTVTGIALSGYALQLPGPVTSLLAVGATVLANRAFHLDGLSDTVDGLAASYDRERSLTVMKSGTSGPAGVAAVVIVVGLQTAGLSALLALPDAGRSAILAGVTVCASRAALVVCCARGVPAARAEGLGRTYTETVPRTIAVFIWVLVCLVLAATGSLAGLPSYQGALAGLLALMTVLAVVVRARSRFGGVTGDVFGAAVELALAAMLVVLSAGVA